MWSFQIWFLIRRDTRVWWVHSHRQILSARNVIISGIYASSALSYVIALLPTVCLLFGFPTFGLAKCQIKLSNQKT